MGDNIYTSFWQSLLPSVINQLRAKKPVIHADVTGLNKYGDRESYYANFRIVNGKLENPKNAHAQGRDLYALLIQDRYFNEDLSTSTIQGVHTKMS